MFSKKAEYALRATIYIAEKSKNDKKLLIDDIALAIDAPRSFTAKILQLLAKGKIISSITGPNGGFYILERARASSVKDILRLIEEDNVLTKCVLGLSECSEKQPCPLHFEYSPLKKQLLQLFERKTVQELADQLKKRRIVLNNRQP